MLEVLQFIFQNLWHFIGTVILIGAIGASLSSVIVALRGRD